MAPSTVNHQEDLPLLSVQGKAAPAASRWRRNRSTAPISVNNFGAITPIPLPSFSLAGTTKTLILELASPIASIWDHVAFPYFPWATLNWDKYLREFAFLDILAGMTVGTLLIAQGLAYAKLASLPPIYGLYASTIAPLSYSLFGTSGQLTIGPVVLVSLFMSQAFITLGLPSASTLTNEDEKSYLTYVKCETATIISLAVAVWLCSMAFFRVGSLMRFLSPSVLTGFVTGAGIYIFLSMLRQVVGITVPKEDFQYKEFQYFFTHLHEAHHYTTLVGVAALGILIVWHALRRTLKPWVQALRDNNPSLSTFLVFLLSSIPLLLMILSSVVTYYIIKKHHLADHPEASIDIIGHVPAGFNRFQVPQIFNQFYGEGITFGSVMVASIPVTLLVYFESVSIARKYAIENKYPIDMNQELWALGLGCFGAAFFQGYPPGGSFARTALKAEVGVKTPLANTVTSVFVSLVLLLGTQFLTYLPLCVLGATVCVSTFNLFDFHDIWRALWVSPRDGLIMVVTLGITVLWNAEKGLEYGVLLSLVVMLIQMSKLELKSCEETVLQYQQPPPAIISPSSAFNSTNKRPQSAPPSTTSSFKNLPTLPLYDTIYHQAYQHHYHPTQPEEWVRVLKLNANLYFGNAVQFADQLFQLLLPPSSTAAADSTTQEEEGGGGISHRPKAVILDASGLIDVDLAALAALEEMIGELSKTGTKIYLAGTCKRVADCLERMELIDLVGERALTKLPVQEVYSWVMQGLTLEDRLLQQNLLEQQQQQREMDVVEEGEEEEESKREKGGEGGGARRKGEEVV